MKKIVFGTLAAATLIASLGTASAQVRDRNWFDLSAVQIQAVDGGGSFGYNKDANSIDAVK